MNRLTPRTKWIAASTLTGCSAMAWWAVINEKSSQSQCEAPPANHVVPLDPQPATAVQVSSLKRWLERRGADITAADIRECSSGAGRFGVFANAETQRRTWPGIITRLKTLIRLQPGAAPIASFPLSSSITAHSILSAPHPDATTQRQLQLLKELLDHGHIDDRTAVMLHVMVERLKRREAELYPWICALPSTFDTPLFWSDKELDLLRGTSLHKATMLRKKALEAEWQQLQPITKQLALQAGLDYAPSYADFLWAYSVFWSRAMGIPKLGSATSAAPSIEDGIVPGLDFCNHDVNARCRWTIYTQQSRRTRKQKLDDTGADGLKSSSSDIEDDGTRIQLVCDRNARLKAGSEIAIDYGDKSNEELLFHYGFATSPNPYDVLMVVCPLPPPSEWDEHLAARIQLLQMKGLRPQLFLPSAELEEILQRREKQSKGGKVEITGPVSESEDLPQGVVDILKVFVMESRELEREIQHIHADQHSNNKTLPTDPVAASGLRMAVLTTLVRLLELKTSELESVSKGTGSLERDEALLKERGGEMTKAQRHALIYRAGQKKLARAYLVYASRLLQQEMRYLAKLTGEPELVIA